MAWQIVLDVLRAQIGGAPARKLVALALAEAANKDGSRAFPGEERLVQYTELSDRRVRAHIESLLDDGIIRKARRGQTNQRAEFEFDLGRLAELSPGEEADAGDRQSQGKRRTQATASAAKRRTQAVEEADAGDRPSTLTHPKTSPTLLGSAVPSREAVFDALAGALGWDTANLTKSERGKLNAAVRDLRGLDPAPTLEEIRQKVEAYPREHPTWGPPTPNAVVGWWSSLGDGSKSPANTDKRAQLVATVETFFPGHGEDIVGEDGVRGLLLGNPLEGNALDTLVLFAEREGRHRGLKIDETAVERWSESRYEGLTG